jgi:hypothetical protein
LRRWEAAMLVSPRSRAPAGIWFETGNDARAYLFEFIEVFYNRQRHQAGLGHFAPAEYAARFRERPPRVQDPGSTPGRARPGRGWYRMRTRGAGS